MTCIVVGTGIIGCSEDITEGGLRQRPHDSILFQETLSRSGSEYGRSLTDPMSLRQTEFFQESPSDTLSFMEVVFAARDLPRELSDSIIFVGSSTVSGGRLADAPPEVIAIFDSNTLKGMAVYPSSPNHVDLGRADSESTSGVVGIANEDVTATNQGTYLTDGQVTRSDWTAITGSATLTTGATYYLDETTAGHLTSTPPSVVGESVVRVGTALSGTTLDIEIAQPVLL